MKIFCFPLSLFYFINSDSSRKTWFRMLLLAGCHFCQFSEGFWKAGHLKSTINPWRASFNIPELIWKWIHDVAIMKTFWFQDFIFTSGSPSTVSSKSTLHGRRRLIFLLGESLQLWQYPSSLPFPFFIFCDDGEELKERLFHPNLDISRLVVIILWLPISYTHTLPLLDMCALHSSKMTLFWL